MDLTRSFAIPILCAIVGIAPLAGALNARAQSADASVPDPVHLQADWWKYFDPGEPELEARVGRFQDRLEALSVSLSQSGAREDRLRGLIVETDDLAERYLYVSAREGPPAPPIRPTQESYTIEELLQLGGRVREANIELALEQEEANQTKRLLAISARRLEDNKAAYLALAPAAAERLDRGLELMRDRFAQAINQSDLDVRLAHLQLLEKSAKGLQAELDYAFEHLRADPAEVDKWAQRANDAESEEQRLTEEASGTRLRITTFGDDPQGLARRRGLEQRIIEFEARIAQATITALQARLARALAEQILEPSEVTIRSLREQLNEHDSHVEALVDALQIWRRATDRMRTAAMEQLANLADSNATLAELHRSRIEQANDTSEQINRLSRQVAQSHTLSKAAALRVAEDSGVVADIAARSLEAISESWTVAKRWSNASLFSINEVPVTALGLLRVVIILVIAWWVSRILRHALERVMHGRETMSRAALYTLGQLSHYFLLVLGFMIALSSIGIDFTKFALFISALGVGLGFGLQAIFSNFVAGLIILFERSLKVGDFVELESGVHGEVREINIRGTLITTNDNIDILVPNSEFVSGRVTNWTLREAYRRVRVPFGVAYGTDKELVKKAGLEAADKVPFTLKSHPSRQPQVWLTEFGDSSLNFELVVWLTQDAVMRPAAVHAAYTWEIETALGKYGIEIPFPQRDLHVRSYFGHKDAEGLRVVRELAEKGIRPVPAPEA